MREGFLTREEALGSAGESRLRLQTIVWLRWVAVVGQLVAIGVVWLVLRFPLPIGYCLAIIALSAWLNVFLRIRYPARYRLGSSFATALLAYDILQVASLIYLTGGIENPFTVLIVAPVTVSAATLPPRSTIVLGVIAAAATVVLTFDHAPLPWYPGMRLDLPRLYQLGLLAAIGACMAFLALYASRLSHEARQMQAALAATELVLSREQRLHALDGLAAAAAHELGTPLGTIVLVAKELERELGANKAHAEDLALLRQQALRCREILQKLTRQPDAQDPLHARLSVCEMLDEAATPYRNLKVAIRLQGRPADTAGGDGRLDPVADRNPGVMFGLGNIIENAADFASTAVDITATWSADDVDVVIADDGPGFPPDLMDQLGEPYVTTRPSAPDRRPGDTTGLGLGFFIAKTLLERSGATLTLENRPVPLHGAVVRIHWPRAAFVTPMSGQSPLDGRPTAVPAS